MRYSGQGRQFQYLRLLAVVVFFFAMFPRAAHAAPTVPAVRVLHATEDVLLIDFTPRYGEATALIAVPWYGDPSLEIVGKQEDLTSLTREEGPEEWPTRAVVLESLGYWREVRLARIAAVPVYRGEDGRVHQVRHVRVRLRFPHPAAISEMPTLSLPAYDFLRRAVLNPRIPTSWLRPRQLAASSPAPDNPPAHRDRALRLIVTVPGIQVVGRDDLLQAGWDVDTINPVNIHLWLNGMEVPMWVTGQADGRLDPGDELRFYAPLFRSPYTHAQVWWLTLEETPGLRWKARPTQPPAEPAMEQVWAVQRTEFDRLYDSALTDAHGEHWFWYDLRYLDFPPYPALDFPFWVDAPASPGQATVTLSLYAYKGEQHDMAFALNGTEAGELHGNWTGRRDVTFSLPGNALREGQNTLTIRGTDAGAHEDGVYVDSISVRYLRRLRAPSGVLTFQGEIGDHTYVVEDLPDDSVAVLDVTSPLAPTLIYDLRRYEERRDGQRRIRFRVEATTPPTYHVQARSTWQRPLVQADTSSDWHNPNQGADVIVIAPRQWHDLLRPWVEWRTAQGHRVALVDLQDVYDEFSYGQVDPEAIRLFLQHAYAFWPDPAPLYVLLVGDGSYDFKDNLGFHPDNVLPPYLAWVDPWLGETASDLKFVEVSGGDDIPDMFVGRWPVGNREELAAVIQKTLFYGRDMPTAEWQRHIVFVTDNYRDAHGRPDAGGDFPSLAEETASGQLHMPFIADRLYYTPWPDDRKGQGYISDVEEMRTSVRLLWNRGAGIINWIGHASYEQWGEEKFLHARDLVWMQNGTRLPFLFSVTCFTGYFHHPEYPSLDEALLTKPDGGTIASWSPTGLAVAYGHQYLQEGFYRALVGGERRIGPLTLLAHLHLLAQAPTYSFLPQTYLILGDPLLSLHLGPVDHIGFIPTLHKD